MAIFNDARWELRHKLSQRMNNDAILGVVASPGSGSFVCATTHWEKADDYFNEWVEVYCYSGTGVGTSAKPTDWDNATHTLTSLPAATLTDGDLVEIHQTYTVEELNSAINEAIDRVALAALQDRVDESLTMTAGTYLYALPTHLVSVIDLYMSDTNGAWLDEDPIDPRYYRWVKRTSGIMIEFIGDLYAPVTGTTLRIVGQASPSKLDTDTEETPIDPEYIIQRAKSILHQSRVRGNNEESKWHANQEGIAAAKARALALNLDTGIKGRAVVDM